MGAKLVVTVGDLAYLSNTWSLSGTGPDGTPVTLGATTAEVARRQADGYSSAGAPSSRTRSVVPPFPPSCSSCR